MKILLATHNPAKIKDYQQILSENGLEVETLNSLEIKEKFEENKASFRENAKDKALFYYNLAKLPTIAEDGGLEIDFLGGEPGVNSHRPLGFEATDEEIIDFFKEKIKSIPEDRRSARFTGFCCLVKSPAEIYTVKNSIEGYLTNEYNNNYPKGFPYRAFFIERTFSKYLMDLTEEEYNQINHRRKNIEQLIRYLK